MPPRHVYVHVPFCARRCSYCDFAIAVRRHVPVTTFVQAIARELAVRTADAEPAEVSSIYLGGGTPSALGPDGVARLLDTVMDRFSPSPEAEVTLEANPEDVDVDAGRRWRAAGVTRVSLGVQSFDDVVLRWMHRTHDAARAERAAEALHAAGISDWSLDLIFALPDALPRSWERDLARAIALHPTHVSCYGLTIEPGTPLGRWRERGEVQAPAEERYEREFLAADACLAAAGFEHYEVSNFARPGSRARHNAAYWSRVAYLGLGPSAHSFDGARRWWNERDYVAWHRRVLRGEDPEAGGETLSPQQERMEATYLGLRTLSGVRFGPEDRPHVREWVERGWASERDSVVRLTPPGWLRLDALAGVLTDARSR